jgi:hypothetical protein
MTSDPDPWGVFRTSRRLFRSYLTRAADRQETLRREALERAIRSRGLIERASDQRSSAKPLRESKPPV